MEGHWHDIAKLSATSACDNVCLELELALQMKSRGSAILPLMVGDLVSQESLGEVYTDFFESGCLPRPIPDVRVEKLHAKLREMLGLEDDVPLMTIKEVFDAVFKEQGVKLKGLRREAVERAVQQIHTCVMRCNETLPSEQKEQFITNQDLPAALGRLGCNVFSDVEWKDLIEQIDLNHDGRISQDELEPMLLHIKKISNSSRRYPEGSDGYKNLGKIGEIGMMRHDAGVPTRDAFKMIPVQGIQESRKIKDLMNTNRELQVLRDLQKHLDLVPEIRDDSLEMEILNASFTDADLDASFTAGCNDSASPLAQVISIIDEWHSPVLQICRSLLFKLTPNDDDSNPLSREGVPDTHIQELLHEMQAIEISMSIITQLFAKGVPLSKVRQSPELVKVKDVVVHLYRLLKQTIKNNPTGGKRVFAFLDVIFGHLGFGFAAMHVLKELFCENQELINKISRSFIQKMVFLLQDDRDPRFVDFLISVCTVNGLPMPKIQKYITDAVLLPSSTQTLHAKFNELDANRDQALSMKEFMDGEWKQGRSHLQSQKLFAKIDANSDGEISKSEFLKWPPLLPCIEMHKDTVRVLLPDSHDATDADKTVGFTSAEPWLSIAQYHHFTAKNSDVGSEIMSRPYASLTSGERKFRYFVRCTNLFGKLALGRNQEVLRCLLCNEHLGLSYSNILKVMKMDSLPMLVRARFITLMQILYVDRNPQVERPILLLTRVWKQRAGNSDVRKAAPPVLASQLQLVLHGQDLKNMDFIGRGDPFLKFLNGDGDVVFTSEVIINDADPTWRDMSIDTERLCYGDEDTVFKIECWDRDQFDEDDQIGYMTTTINELRQMKPLPLRSDVDESEAGTLVAVQLALKKETTRENTEISSDLSLSEIPFCNNNFSDLRAFLLTALHSFEHDDRDNNGGIEFDIALLNLCREMMKFSLLFTSDKESIDVEFKDAKRFFAVLFRMIKLTDSEFEGGNFVNKTRKSGLRMDLRALALKCVITLCDLRANFRVSSAIDCFERIFDRMQKNENSLAMTSLHHRDSVGDIRSDGKMLLSREEIINLFKSFDHEIDALSKRCFTSDIVSPVDIGADRVCSNGMMDRLLGLMVYQNQELTTEVMSLVIRQQSQQARLIKDLSTLSMLVYSDTVEVFDATHSAIYRLAGIQKGLNANIGEAYAEATDILQKMRAFLQVSPRHSQSSVRMNQKVMMDLRFDVPLTNILRLDLERIPCKARGGQGEQCIGTDVAVNSVRRQLFQEALDVLQDLVAGYRKGQRRMQSWIPFFMEHVGIGGLDVVSCVGAIMEGDDSMCSGKAVDHIVNRLISANIKYGRRSRWMRTLELFLFSNGRVLHANQNKILNLLLEDQDVLLDFTCDYTDGSKNLKIAQDLESDDPRRGMDRIALMIANDHKLRVHSLLEFHLAGVRLLAMCAAGNNQAGKEILSQVPEISLIECIANVLDINQRGARVDLDVIYRVQCPWVQLISNVYLTFASGSEDALKFARTLQFSSRWWPSKSALDPQSVVGQFVGCLISLKDRLESIHVVPHTIINHSDAVGGDLSQHVALVEQILEALSAFLSHGDYYSRRSDVARDELVEDLSRVIEPLSVECCRHRLTGVLRKLFALREALVLKGFQKMHVEECVDEADDGRKAFSLEKTFLDNWEVFCARIAIELKVNTNPNKTMIRFSRDLAFVFGSRKTRGNEKLEKLRDMILLTPELTLDAQIKLTNLRVITAILYLQPDVETFAQCWRESQWQKFVRSEEPLNQGEDISGVDAKFAQLCEILARLGTVNTVINCTCSEDPEISLAALRLGVILLQGRRAAVQDQFHDSLELSGGEAFFTKLQNILVAGSQQLQNRERETSHVETKIGIETEQTIAVLSLMQGLFLGQHLRLQNLLRGKNPSKINLLRLSISPLAGLVSSVSSSTTHGGGLQIAEGVQKGFEMLAESMSGANLASQHELANNGFLDLADRVYSTLQLEPKDSSAWLDASVQAWYKRRSRRVDAAPDELESHDEHMDMLGSQQANILRSNIKQAVTRSLLVFLEGMQSRQALIRQICVKMQWRPIMKQLDKAYDSIGRESCIPTALVTKEGIGYYILLKSFEMFDTDAEQIKRLLSKSNRQTAVKYFEARVGCLEIFHRGMVERVMFPLPAVCLAGGLLTDKSHWDDIVYAREWTNREKKNWELVHHILDLVAKEQHISRLQHSIFAFTVKYWHQIRTSSFICTLFLHLVIIFASYKPPWLPSIHYSPSDEQTAYEEEAVHKMGMGAARLLTYLHCAISAFRACAFALGQCPLIVAQQGDRKRGDAYMPETSNVPDETDGAENLASAMGVFEARSTNAWKIDLSEAERAEPVPGRHGNNARWVRLLWRPRFWYEVCLLLASMIAVGFNSPLPTGLSLIDMIFWEKNKVFLHAITHSAVEVASTVVVGLLFVYVYLILALWSLPLEIDTSTCSNLFQCTAFALQQTFSGCGSLLEIFHSPFASPHTAVVIAEDPSMWRFLFEISYQILVGQIIMAVIVAVLIDSMQELRFNKIAAANDLKNRCFLCDLSSLRLEQAGIDFTQHVQTVHNPQFYLYFLIYLRQKNVTECSAVERYVRERTWEGEGLDVQWLPRDTTWLMALSSGSELVVCSSKYFNPPSLCVMRLYHLHRNFTPQCVH